ncbi:MAG: DUF475 domain-containing protein [Aliarcobacter sp.]|nr:DUF475 domain-containing protein [Aliarcobacter sp.]
MKHFKYSFIITFFILCFIIYHGYINGGISSSLNLLWLTVILILMEVSLSFDNAIVNASILKHWNDFWKKMFLTVGMFVAVFGMRLLFPLLIVAFTANLTIFEVWTLALNNPQEYSQKLIAHHTEVSAFGSMFLLLVFLNFLFDDKRELFWIGKFEQKLSTIGKTKFSSYIVSILFLYIFSFLLEDSQKMIFFTAGGWGILVYLSIHLLCNILENSSSNAGNIIKTGSIGGFIYLEVLDASFSFDGVIGAFAITKDIITIMVGLGVGALFVRSITIYLVEKETLDEYVFLEHGAHYAIGILSFIMLLNIKFHIPEAITGFIGIAFILLSLYSSIKYNRRKSSSIILK